VEEPVKLPTAVEVVTPGVVSVSDEVLTAIAELGDVNVS
jgi:hypothetical protein